MNCEKAMQLLDAYVDGELAQEELQALENHAKACEACRRELRAARLLKHTLAHMDDELAVPLQAQAAWRNAVRAEAQKKKRNTWLRGAYAVAAALVIMLGVGLAFNVGSDRQPALMTRENSSATQAIVARDGGVQAVYSLEDSSDYTVWKKLDVEKLDQAMQTAEMLADEYSGTCRMESEGICRIEIPYEYLEDFLKAASHIGVETDSEIMEQEAETAVVLFQFNEK